MTVIPEVKYWRATNTCYHRAESATWA